MSIGPVFGAANVAGTSAAQRNGTDVERAQQEVTNQGRQVSGQRKAEAAEGVGSTETDNNETHDRDADGRRLWEVDAEDENAPDRQQSSAGDSADQKEQASSSVPGPKDPHGDLGNSLDLLAE